MEHAFESTSVEAMRARIAALEAALAAEHAALESERARSKELEGERDRALAAYRALLAELEVLRRKIFAAKAERIDTAQLELEFAGRLAALGELEEQLEASEPESTKGTPPKSKPKPKGRRKLADSDLPVERIEIDDPVMEALVAEGRAERIGFEESSRVAYRRGGLVRCETARVKYRVIEAETVATAPMPATLLPRSLATPSLLAKIASDKYTDALPLYRQEDRFAREGLSIDRGTMSRWLEEVGNLVGATVLTAARKEALASAFCIATDATGVLVQPIRTHEKTRRACRRAHFFVQIADRDHVFFEYVERETSAAVHGMFRGFSGYVQADAKSVYDLLFRQPVAADEVVDDGARRTEVGCWSHARRYFYQAAITKDEAAREALYRIHRIFELEAKWRKKSRAQRRELRDRVSRPHVDAFFEWAEIQWRAVEHQRGLVRTAFGYVRRQKDALMRFLDDGRLLLDNNRSERELRRIAVGRKNWLFVGSDDHGEAAAALLSLIASCKLHALDPEAYLRDLFRVLPHWPDDRHLELAPKYWLATRARLDADELGRELGPLTIPPPEEKPPPS